MSDSLRIAALKGPPVSPRHVLTRDNCPEPQNDLSEPMKAVLRESLEILVKAGYLHCAPMGHPTS